MFIVPSKKKRIFGATNLNEILTWVDASYEIHHTMRIQIGGESYTGMGVTPCRSRKHKLNTKISTKTELVGARNYVPYNIWCIMFMHHQVYINRKQVFTRQLKLDDDGNKWEKLLYSQLLAHQNQIFILIRIGYTKERSELCIVQHTSC